MGIRSLLPEAKTIFRGVRKIHGRFNDFVRQTQLSNGISFASQKRLLNPDLEFCIRIRAGSLEDPPGLEGVAHFLEHVLIDPDDHAEVSRRGGNLDLRTGSDSIQLTGDIPNTAENREFIIGVIAGILNRDHVPEAGFQRERQRILNEIGLYNDLPDSRRETFMRRAYKGERSPANVLGSKENVRSITVEDLLSFKKTWFTGPNIYIGMTGRFDHARMHETLEKALSGLPSHPIPARDIPEIVPGDYRNPVDYLEQLYFGFCFPISDVSHEKIYVRSVAMDYLSHRINHEMVFRSGTVYSAGANLHTIPGRAGLIEIRGNTLPEHAGKAAGEVSEIITSSMQRIDPYLFDSLKRNALRSFEREKLWRPTHHASQMSIYLSLMGTSFPDARGEDMLRSVTSEDVQDFFVHGAFARDPAIVTYGDDSRLGSYEDFVGPIRAARRGTGGPEPGPT